MQPSSMQDLLNQYTQNIQHDPRVFSQDVMKYEDFANPFEQWTKNIAQQYMRPEFERYTLNPYNQQANQQVGQINQQTGSSGGWRTSMGRKNVANAQNQSMLGREELERGYGDRVLGMYDQFKSQWIDPLYQSRFTNFYEAPWRNANVGTINPTLTPTNPNNTVTTTPLTTSYGL